MISFDIHSVQNSLCMPLEHKDLNGNQRLAEWVAFIVWLSATICFQHY